MMHHSFRLHNIMPHQVSAQVQVLSDAHISSVALVATQLRPTWIILDYRLKKEADYCLKKLNCNVVLIDHSIPKTLSIDKDWLKKMGNSPSLGTSRSTSTSQSQGLTSRENPKLRNIKSSPPGITEKYDDPPKSLQKPRIRANELAAASLLSTTVDIRREVSLPMKQPPSPSYLCSICKNRSPISWKAPWPRRFSYREIEIATEGFSAENLLDNADGYGRVYRGVLPSGLFVAVKQHKAFGVQGASEFCSEIEVLSCAQHKNLVMMAGYCIEIEGFLVYEFACNGSLDKHLLPGREKNEVMCWESRMKVAVGTARGLKYLHEDCRVGCVVHGDLKPTNILLTHDFEPLVGDFGLARRQVDGQLAQGTRANGAFGYMAPEYALTGLVTEKADVYAFGVVLLELLSGTKPTEFSENSRLRNLLQQVKGVQGLERLLKRKIYDEIIDPRLQNNYAHKQVECMLDAAMSCLSPHPQQRPTMSKVLKILEGDAPRAVNHPELRLKWNNEARNGWQNRMQQSPPYVENRISNEERMYENEIADGKSNFDQSEHMSYQEYHQYLLSSLFRFCKVKQKEKLSEAL
ncbi:Non-specific serine/threonine protein kinase [Bertholletia excelsa]